MGRNGPCGICTENQKKYKIMKVLITFISTVVLTIILPYHSFGQATFNPDKKFLEARELAFDGQRKEAIQLAKKIVDQYPGYSDVWILLGRIHSWDGKYDSASVFFEKALEQSPTYEDAYVGYLDNLFWGERYAQAEKILKRAYEKLSPPSAKITYRKAKLAYYRKSYKEALELAEQLYGKDAKIKGLLSFIQKIKRVSISNAVGLSFNHDSFDGQAMANLYPLCPAYHQAFGKCNWQG